MILLDLLARGTALLALAILGAWLLRRGPAALRHRIWAFALLGLLALPLLDRVVPAWRIPLPAASAPTPPAPVLAEAPTALPSPMTEDLAPQPEARPFSWGLLALGVWGIGVAVCLLPVAAGGLQLHRLVRAPLPDPLRAELAQAAGRLKLRRTPTSALAIVPVPLTFGWPTGTVLLPADAVSWPSDRLQAALLHEAAHLSRGDWAWQMVAELARALWWFHPLAWLAFSRLRAEAETASDRRVLDSGVAAPEYAGHLVDIALTLRKGVRP